MIKRNEEKFKRLAENFDRSLEKLKAMNDEELCNYIIQKASMMFFVDTGISGSIDSLDAFLLFKIPFTREELADYLNIDLNPANFGTVGLRTTLNMQYLKNKSEILKHFLIEKKEEFYKSITDYMEKKLTDNGINKRYDDLIAKLNSIEGEEFANYIYKETVILTNTLSGGIYGMIDGVEFKTSGDGLLNLPKEDIVNEEKMYITILANKRIEIINSIKKSKERELKLYLESEGFF